MGFGLLFIGYLLTFGCTAGTNYVLSVFGITGTLILFLASKKLSLYSANFKNAQYTSIALGLSFALNAVVQLCKARFYQELDSVFVNIASGVVVAVTFLYHFFMYKGIMDIAKTAENDKIFATAFSDIVLMIVYYFALVFSRFIYPYFPKVSAIFIFSGMILGYVWILANVILVLGCYMRICLEGDENMPDIK